MELRTLASGSSGNCTLISCGNTHLLIDAGISCRKITQRLKAAGVERSALSGILITHEHSDHIAGLTVFLKQNPVPVYATPATAAAIARKMPSTYPCLHTVPADSSFVLGDCSIRCFSTPHDAADSVGYLVAGASASAAVVTDLGHFTDHVRDAVTGVDLALIESNHDVDWLQDGPYPFYLQQRILGDYGHLSNEAGASLAVYLAQHGTKTLILGHLSKENNTPERARTVVETALQSYGLAPRVAVAPRDELSEEYVV